MKLISLSILILLCKLLDAQTRDTVTAIIVDNSSLEKDTITPQTNKYGDLLNDDPFYNPKYAWWKPSVRVVAANAFNWALAKYFYKFDWPATSITDWKNNFKKGPEWDVDRFGTNFIGHPHTGNYYFNIARSNGYSYWGSLPYALQGSLTWEYLGENERPSYNDLIVTPISGAFLGEVFYRISSNILDDRTRGKERVWREVLAGVINPPRAFNRLTQGKMFRVTNKEVYQKEPLNITFSAGAHRVNEDNKFGTGTTTGIINLQFDYGDPFEVRERESFDVFRLRLDGRFVTETKFLDNVTGYGLVFGNNVVRGHGLVGRREYCGCWHDRVLEMGAPGFGVGLLSGVS